MNRAQAEAVKDAIQTAGIGLPQTYPGLTVAENRLRAGIVAAALQAIRCRLLSFASGSDLTAPSGMSFTLPVFRKVIARILVDTSETDLVRVDLVSPKESRSLARLHGRVEEPELLLHKTTSWQDMTVFLQAFGSTYGKQTAGLPDDAYGRLLAVDGGLPGAAASVTLKGMRQARASTLVHSVKDTLTMLSRLQPEPGATLVFDDVAITRTGPLAPVAVSIGGHTLILLDQRADHANLHICHVGGAPISCRPDFFEVISADLDADLQIIAMVAERCRQVEFALPDRPKASAEAIGLNDRSAQRL